MTDKEHIALIQPKQKNSFTKLYNIVKQTMQQLKIISNSKIGRHYHEFIQEIMYVPTLENKLFSIFVEKYIIFFFQTIYYL